MPMRDRDSATEQTVWKTSVGSLIIQTIEHKGNSFKYILMYMFDRRREALSPRAMVATPHLHFEDSWSHQP